MPDLASRIRDYYDAAADPVEAVEVFADVKRKMRPGRRSLRPVWAAVAGTVVVLVAFSPTVLFGDRDDVVGEPMPGATLPPPSVVTAPQVTLTEEPESPAEEVGTLPEGLSCQDLALSGYDYPEAVAYWTRYELPLTLDPDGNGVPCENAYPEPEVAAVYGGPGAAPFRSVSNRTTNVQDDSFMAWGPAVDAGIVCQRGGIEETPPRSSSHRRALNRMEEIYRCDDGSGTFIVRVDVFINVRGVGYGVWTIKSGTGDYELLTGGGHAAYNTTGYSPSSETYIGRLTSTVNEN